MTGATGFAGSHVLEILLAAGHHVLYLTRGRNDWRIRDFAPSPQAQPLTGGLDDLDSLKPPLASFSPDAVVHLAWSGVTGAFRNRDDQQDNYEWTNKLARLSAECGAKHFIGLGSQAEYGPHQGVISELTAEQPVCRYGTAKLEACRDTARLCAEQDMRFAWLRLFSAYGPKDSPDFLIPYLCRAFANREKPSLTPCEQLWDYIYIADVASAVRAAVEAPEADGVFNLGSGQAYPLREIVETVRDLIDPDLPIGFGEKPYAEQQIMWLQADISKLRSATKWRPIVPLKEGLEKTVRWYANN